jgi:hypothetical protein
MTRRAWGDLTPWQRLDAWANGTASGADYIGTGAMMRDLRALLRSSAAPTPATPRTETVPTTSEGDE